MLFPFFFSLPSLLPSYFRVIALFCTFHTKKSNFLDIALAKWQRQTLVVYSLSLSLCVSFFSIIATCPGQLNLLSTSSKRHSRVTVMRQGFQFSLGKKVAFLSLVALLSSDNISVSVNYSQTLTLSPHHLFQLENKVLRRWHIAGRCSLHPVWVFILSNQHSDGIKIHETRAEESRTEEMLTQCVFVCAGLRFAYIAFWL